MASPFLELFMTSKWKNVCPQLLSIVIRNRLEVRGPVGVDHAPAVAVPPILPTAAVPVAAAPVPVPAPAPAPAAFFAVNPAPNAAVPPAIDPAPNAAAPPAVNPAPNAAVVHAAFNHFVAVNPAPDAADYALIHALPDDPLLHDASPPPADFVNAAPPPNTANDDDDALVFGLAPLPFHELASPVPTASTVAPFAASIPAFEDSIIPPLVLEPLTTPNTPA